MKIACTLWEFAQMKQSCEYYQKERACEGCVLLGVGYCGPIKNERIEDMVSFEITDRNDFEKIVIN